DRGKRRSQGVEKCRQLLSWFCGVVYKISVGLQIERIFVPRALCTNEQSMSFLQAMPDAQLVKDVGIVDRDVGDHDIGEDEQPEHVLPNVPLSRDFARCAPLDPTCVERRRDQLFLDLVEIDTVFDSEGPNDECARYFHLRTSEVIGSNG